MRGPAPFTQPVAKPWIAHDFYIYGRQSDPRSVGNQGTGMQEEDLRREVCRRFGLEGEDNPRVHSYFEQESGTDASTRLIVGTNGELQWQNFRRKVLLRLFSDLVDRHRLTGRPAIICVSLLNRLGRSLDAVTLVTMVAQEVRGNLLIWSVDSGALLDPLSEGGHIQLVMMCGIAGMGESRTKSTFVKAARARIIQNDPLRSLGERWVGYREYPCDKRGIRLADPYTRPDHYRYEFDPVQVAMVTEAFRLASEGVRPRAIAEHLQQTYGNHPRHGRSWSRNIVVSMLRNPVYTGYRVYNRNTSIQVGGSRRRNTRPSEHIYSPFCPELQIIEQRIFEAVQHQLKVWAGGRDCGTVEREPCLYRSDLGRCGICGRRLSVSRRRGQYFYVCDGLDWGAKIRCTSLQVTPIDEYLVAWVRQDTPVQKAAEIRRALDQQASTVWLWPDGVIWIQTPDQPSVPPSLGRSTLIASDWPEDLDTSLLFSHFKQLVRSGRIPKHQLRAAISMHTAWAIWRKETHPVDPRTVLKLFSLASKLYVDIAGLRSVLGSYMRHAIDQEGRNWTQLEAELGPARQTLWRISTGRRVRRGSILKAAVNLELIDSFSAPPPGVPVIRRLDEIVSWLVDRRPPAAVTPCS